MAAAGKEGETETAHEFVYRISTADEWEELRKSGLIFGGEFDKTSGFIHLSDLHQVQPTLQNFFLNTKAELYLLQIDAKKLGDGLIYELVDDSNRFPHFYGPSCSFSPLPLSAVTKAEKLLLSDGDSNFDSKSRLRSKNRGHFLHTFKEATCNCRIGRDFLLSSPHAIRINSSLWLLCRAIINLSFKAVPV